MTRQDMARAALREPLLHFLLAGFAVFLLFQFRSEAVDPESRRIVISEEVARKLAARFEQSMQRAPNGAEMDGIIREHIREEVYYREGLRLGLDADDEVIRRRLRSKMEYLARAEAEAAMPDEKTLQRWLDRNAARYAADTRYSFDQIFLGAETEQAAPILVSMRGGADWQSLGKAISLPKSVERADNSEILKQFGEEFAVALAGIEPGEWSNVIPSGYGFHLVRVRAQEAGRRPKLADIRQRVENDWRAATAADREAKAYQALLDGYSIKIEKP